ncbi:TolC family protein [Deinococcus cavernae]|uniref:TolC family protein n=1 Tax=Deinococcus cavernae TaxID=2320857 RepID=A0A418UZQ1_9DEIO|nr:TolC family protein [Deinococcus cavernae]RJF68954.1 TolC family protein [Deinococcus cavernae]
MPRLSPAVLLTPLLLTAVAHAQTGASSTALSAGSAVSAALNSHADVKTAQANLDKAAATNRAAQSDPSTLVAAKLSASNAASLAQAQLRSARLNVMQDTVSAYTTLYEAQQNVEVQALQVQADQKAVQVAQVKQQVGNATALDVQNARNTLSASQQALADAQAQVSLAQARLGTLTGLGSAKAASAPGAPKLSTTLTKLQAGLNALTTLVSAGNAVSEAQLNVKLADNDFTPARTLQDARIAQANAQRSLDSVRKAASQTLASAYQAAQNSYQLLTVAQSREAAAQKTYNQDSARLKSGTISAVDLQATQLTLKKAQYARTQAQGNVLEALAALSVAAGQNLTGLGGF